MTVWNSTQVRDGWTKFGRNVEQAFAFPKGRHARLIRPRYPRKIAGVCSGMAEYFGWDATLLRVLVVVLAVASSGMMAAAYALAWLLIPEGQYALPHSTATGTSPS